MPHKNKAIRAPRRLSLVPLLLVTLLAACGGKSKKTETPAGEASSGGIARDPRLDERPRCVTPGRTLQTVDLTGDGQFNIRHALDGELRVCTEYDLNLDGKIDSTRFYEDDGVTVKRAEFDYDFDGLIDEVLVYERGALVRRELDTNFDHRIDTWVLCHEGYVVRAERDRKNRGKPDVFEDYKDGLLVRAAYDDDLDGKPDRFEIFEAGLLVAVGADTDGDGEPDDLKPISAEAAGPAIERALCEEIEPEEEGGAS